PSDAMRIVAKQNGNRVSNTALHGGRARRRLRGKRILVLEGDVFQALDIRDWLEQLGCIVAGPTSYLDEARRLARTGLDGAVLQARLRARGTSESVATMLRQKAVPFFVISAYPQDRLPPELAKAPFLAKPLSRKAVQGMAVDLFRD